RGSCRAIPAHLSAAPRAGTRDVLLPRVRTGVLGVSLCRVTGLSRGTDARNFYRGVRGGLRTVRLFACLRDRDDHGLRATAGHRGSTWHAQFLLSRTGRRRQRMSGATSLWLSRAWRGLLV